MPGKGKILMGKAPGKKMTPVKPMQKKKDVEFVSQSKTNSGLLYGKKTGKTYVKEGAESYKMIMDTPGKRPGPVKPKTKPAMARKMGK